MRSDRSETAEGLRGEGGGVIPQNRRLAKRLEAADRLSRLVAALDTDLRWQVFQREE
jgi:hypothetical protein